VQQSNATRQTVKAIDLLKTNPPTIEGTLKPGRFGDEYMYVCDDDARIMLVRPELYALIQQSGARSGDEIAICKREMKDGNRKSTQWEVQKVANEPAAASPTRQASAAQPAPVRTAQPAAGPAAAPAVDAALEAEHYAAANGYSLRPGTEDVRVLAITAFIQFQGGRR
jgi:hypothetical protein